MVLKVLFISFVLLQFFSACTSKSPEKKLEETSASKEINAKALYTLHCEACHGMDGTKGVSGAANLKVSKMTDNQIQSTIENGNEKGMMPFKDIIQSKTEIDALVIFVKSLRN
jgi:mono/diheme cytochrome c family protein